MLFRSVAQSFSAPSSFLLRSAPSGRRTLTSTRPRFDASKGSSAYREGLAQYKTFASPFAKVFLGAIFTYQVIYWTWLKLEMDESKFEKNQEVAALEKKARELTNAQK
ncbi:hypothetical protein IFM58399_07579 [Aspergillus lentulus]|uniref:Inner membrane assembly complex subunit 17 n=1 Tax=Aspergillus lentulus TaxID=293939 RepID=A0ABQ1A5D1_ASPLE|nr:uncharacterized protein IFM58399_07579 [Aspergillus lentulus]GFF45574.1 hypothetical protein IFM58399_07579 [Aspergillus lentulus]GFF57322.1 hypothetical protein IFM62136_03393 [Aspergillus lentulus]GFF73943.1 hypothetical protein IFM60648_04065 [Aspergillus lentulus]GFF92640.1 hypothetical protein IFM47457_09255 [Aspergillus lentulus]GFG13866.1 hypothetical protein IFM61392_08152 [Aspergillus lentulus]